MFKFVLFGRFSRISISKNREKCGLGLVGHGSSIDVIYIGGAQAGGPVVRAKWPILRYSVFANYSIRWRRRGTIRRKLLIARDHRDENGQNFPKYFFALSFNSNFRNYEARIASENDLTFVYFPVIFSWS